MINKMKELLDKYFEGTATLTEEQELRKRFSSEDIPEELQACKALFAFFEEERAVMPPARRKNIRRIGWIVAAAASVALLLMVGWPSLPKEDAYTYYVNGTRIYDKEAAIAEAESKLQTLAASMQRVNANIASFGKLHEVGQSLEQWNKIQDIFRQIERKNSIAPETDLY
jgi:hypothetical protein